VRWKNSRGRRDLQGYSISEKSYDSCLGVRDKRSLGDGETKTKEGGVCGSGGVEVT